MKKALTLAGLVALLCMAAPSGASAHTHVFWKCATNGTNSHGTTKIHVHHKQPSAQHMRRHHCHKVIRRHKSHTKVVVVPGPTQVIYVNQPCPSCPSPDNGCDNRCDENRCEGGCGDENEGHKEHGNKHGHDKGKCD